MGNFYMESTQINYRRDEKLKTVDQKLQELSETSAIDTDIAPVFKSTNTYQPGDMVYYRNKLYVFNVEHTGAWAAADVTATDVTTTMNAGLDSLKSGLIDVNSKLTQYSVGPIDFGTDNYVNSLGTFIKKNNGVKMLQLAISSTSAIIPTGDWITVLTIPTEYAPLNAVVDNRVNTDGHYFTITITTTGEVKIYNYGSNTKIDGSYLIVFI